MVHHVAFQFSDSPRDYGKYNLEIKNLGLRPRFFISVVFPVITRASVCV